MEQTVFELDLLEEARDFLKSLTKEIRGKLIDCCHSRHSEKDAKTPKSEITKAEGIRKQYFENKNKKT